MAREDVGACQKVEAADRVVVSAGAHRARVQNRSGLLAREAGESAQAPAA